MKAQVLPLLELSFIQGKCKDPCFTQWPRCYSFSVFVSLSLRPLYLSLILFCPLPIPLFTGHQAGHNCPDQEGIPQGMNCQTLLLQNPRLYSHYFSVSQHLYFPPYPRMSPSWLQKGKPFHHHYDPLTCQGLDSPPLSPFTALRKEQ